MVELSKFKSTWISSKNVRDFLGKKLVVQNFDIVDGMYGSNIVLYVKVVDGDNEYPTMKVRLNRVSIENLERKGVTQAEELIGKAIKLSTVKTRMGESVLVDLA
ncbi:hypothetical protein [Sulfolobus ellipsoid virus 1]|uniref:Uncharacterized protein n=1 Tax=Sulfolobus ellipsoid virus 1 TaxID=2056194 RepID=A0A2H4RBQ9_9VIRU|nr:hypothetical protein FGG62_gp10 [Sulfolobus ellipsoid virus 1]ATY46488.1 hypothetical protein [Sulfolobus ellipsoid virus 1]